MLKPWENLLCTEIVSDIQNNFYTQHVLPNVLQKEELLTKIYLYLRLCKAISQCLLNYTVQRLCTASSKQKSVKLFSNKRPLKCDFKSMQWGLVLALIAPSKYCLISDASTMLCRLQLTGSTPVIIVRQDQRCKGEFYKSHNLFIIRKLVPQALGAWHSIAHCKFNFVAHKIK